MITFKAKDFDYSGTKDRVEGECLSTDTKPTEGIANGSCLIEMDTGDRFMFDEAGSQWLNITNPGGGGGAEVWLVGDTGVEQGGMMTFTLSNVDATDHITELWTNAGNYQVFLNGAELPYFLDMSTEDGLKTFADGNTEESISKMVQIQDNGSSVYTAGATYMDASTAPTSVEVSVKAK